MKLCIISGIFAPESGGPGTYAPKIAEALASGGYVVTVVTFSSYAAYPGDSSFPFRIIRVVRGNKLLNRVRFFFACFEHVRKSDCVYMLDWFAAGLPASLVARMFRIPYVVRVGGDYLWEQRYLESGANPVTLSDFYEKGLHRKRSYRAYAGAIGWVLHGAAHVIFNAEKMRALYVHFYGIDSNTSSVISNPVPRAELGSIRRNAPTKEFVFWGRFIVMKNIPALVRAFAAAKIPNDFTLALIGDGPRKKEVEALVNELGIEKRVTILPAMPQRDVLERVKDSRAFVLTSWTDISPNQVYEALAIGLPAIVTKENYLSIADSLPMTVDPRSVEDISSALEVSARDEEYRLFSGAFRHIDFKQSWFDAAAQHRAIFEKVV